MASQRPAWACLSGDTTNLPTICALLGVLLFGAGSILAQPAPSASSPFQARVEEAARALQNTTLLKNLSEKQQIDRVEFVVGNTLFLLLHEMVHVLIVEMRLPVLGREEDAADTFAVLAMLKIMPVRLSENGALNRRCVAMSCSRFCLGSI